MIMPQGSSGTLHDLVVAYAKKAHSMPQLVALHYTIEVNLLLSYRWVDAWALDCSP